MSENVQYFIYSAIMEDTEQKQETPVMQTFNETKSSIAPKKALVIFIVLLLLGAGTGYGLNKFSNQTGANVPILPKNDGVSKGKTFGSSDTKTFKDSTEGKLEKGGIDGEGQYHLVRPGGESQNVYLTSSLVDLSKFIGKKIKVWGETQAAQKAGWLMDVGRVEVK